MRDVRLAGKLPYDGTGLIEAALGAVQGASGAESDGSVHKPGVPDLLCKAATMRQGFRNRFIRPSSIATAVAACLLIRSRRPGPPSTSGAIWAKTW